MHRRAFLASCTVGVAGLAGCGGDAGNPTATQTTTDPQTTTDTGTTTSTATETTLPAEAVLDYDALSADQREAFERARNETMRFSTGVPGLEKQIHYGLDVFEPFRNHDYVRQDGAVYELSTDRSGLIAGTRVTVEPVETADGGSVIALNERTGEGVELIERAIETDGSGAEVRVDPPENIAVGDVVEHDGERYRVTQISSRDYEYFRLTVRVVDD